MGDKFWPVNVGTRGGGPNNLVVDEAGKWVEEVEETICKWICGGEFR